MNYKLLDKINFPEDLKKLSLLQLKQLSQEVREFVIESVGETGGHFGSNLGVVELTVALHYVFNTPNDLLIWDVGHQAYPHKILTGRKNKLKTIRKKDGLAPFPKREESQYDVFDVGHSSTSISAGVGMAVAEKSKKRKNKEVIAIIGDGALGGGVAFEALNHAGDIKADMLVILNDNEMSISPNVGAMHKYLTRLISSPAYNKIRQKGKSYLKRTPKMEELVKRLKKQTKGAIVPGTLFEEMGFSYFGPIDGHDIGLLVETLKNLQKIKGPKLLHIITAKGKGYKQAENDKFRLHATKPFRQKKISSKTIENKKAISYTEVFSDWICDAAKEDQKLYAITPAMTSGSGLLKFAEKFPSRFYDVGIAEQHAVTFAAGLAIGGKKPVVAIYSSFLQRAYDQLIHDVALQNLNVIFAIDRAGIVGPDGATHAGSFDLSFLRPIPNLVIMAPANGNECYGMLQVGYEYNGPVAVRYPRGGSGEEYNKKDRMKQIEFGKAEIIEQADDKDKNKLAILAFGAMVDVCRPVAKKLKATLVNMRFVKPLDEELLQDLARNHNRFITVEDNVIAGGAGSAVNEFVMKKGLDIKVKNLGLPDEFLPHGSREEILEMAGLSSEKILREIKRIIKEST